MAKDKDSIVIVSYARTPMGNFKGELAGLSATQLGSTAIKAVKERAGAAAGLIDEVFMGCVLPAGLGQAPARQAAIGAEIPRAVPCTTISKVCGSGMKAVMLAHDTLVAGSANAVVAGGMESMTNAPYMLLKGRSGYGIGHGQVVDHMMLDGLEDAYTFDAKGGRQSMGVFGELCADKYGFTREDQDKYAIESVTRAQEATKSGAFKDEIAPVTLQTKTGDVTVDSDEGPRKINTSKIPSLKSAFKRDGTITAASSSSISDGASALLLMRASTAAEQGLKPVARILGHAGFAQEPSWFTTAPVFAIQKLCERLGWRVADVDLFEVNEAFAVVAMAAMKDLDIPRDKMNVHGGACALGHPIGASGARILTTLIGALKAKKGKTGIASLCIGGGEATAVAIEML